MINLKSPDSILLLGVSACVLLFTFLHLPIFFLRFYVVFIFCIIICSLKFKDRDTTFISFIALIPVLLEMMIFDTGLISLKSSDEERLFQNTVIFGIQFLSNLAALIPMVLRVEFQTKIWPFYEPKLTIADNVFPYTLLLSSIVIFCSLIENYLRNGLGYDIKFFYSIYDIVGYFVLSTNATILTYLTINSYKDERFKKLPSLKKPKNRNNEA
ncbi:hypothetical protein NI389_06970 [Pseudoalteromonas xiamenensis]|uniref:hypothetical protein n=1 Tax=Pseudoalteromonas xiamenensis TaxID=882626 RepID=UPI0027E56253|nr:hypothetical protein [Pseudoalteromonas xiamenensis]WMN61121.1 hypothetical protein NI389_06970 [Pseudoalteromonas xiamenensis]